MSWLVIVDDFDRRWAIRGPNETHSKLVVDPDRILTFAAAGKRLKTIARRGSQVTKLNRSVQEAKLPACNLDEIGWKTSRMPAVKYGLRGSVPESPDHREYVSLNDTDVKLNSRGAANSGWAAANPMR